MSIASRPRILVTNDDGVRSPGLEALVEALTPLGEVYVVAPEQEMSGCSHSLLFGTPLKYRWVNPRTVALNSTPVACVKFGFAEWFRDQRPALVASGINRGANLGNDVNYSGTVAAALEGAFLGAPALAVSFADRAGHDFHIAHSYIQTVAKGLLSRPFPKGSCLNVNIPPGPAGHIKGVKVTRQGQRVYYDAVAKKGNDEEGSVTLHILQEAGRIPEDGTDLEAVADGWISVTPLSLDFTHHGFLEELRQWPM